jgi:predicted nucleic acid-binding Zn ribbon protein
MEKIFGVPVEDVLYSEEIPFSGNEKLESLHMEPANLTVVCAVCGAAIRRGQLTCTHAKMLLDLKARVEKLEAVIWAGVK